MKRDTARSDQIGGKLFFFDIICSTVLYVINKRSVKMGKRVKIGVGVSEGDASNVKICDVLIV